jgi:hypothetical protein
VNWPLLVVIGGSSFFVWWLFKTFQFIDIAAGAVIISLLTVILWFTHSLYVNTRRGGS